MTTGRLTDSHARPWRYGDRISATQPCTSLTDHLDAQAMKPTFGASSLE